MLRKCRQASSPSLCGMLVYKEETSSVTRIAFSGSGPRFWSWRRKCKMEVSVQEVSGDNQQIQRCVQ